MKSTPLLLAALLLTNCASKDSLPDFDLNASALHDPETIHLLDGVEYKFAEGTLMGRGQRFHNDYSYRRAVIIGEKGRITE
jgi:hypothetical protein